MKAFHFPTVTWILIGVFFLLIAVRITLRILRGRFKVVHCSFDEVCINGESVSEFLAENNKNWLASVTEDGSLSDEAAEERISAASGCPYIAPEDRPRVWNSFMEGILNMKDATSEQVILFDDERNLSLIPAQVMVQFSSGRPLERWLAKRALFSLPRDSDVLMLPVQIEKI